MRRALVLLATLAVGVVAVGAVHAAMPAWYARLWYPLAYEEIVRGHARNYDLDPALLAAVIYTESRFDPDAESPTGAIGLMQLQPATAKGIALRTGGSAFTLADLYDPEINVRYGSWYLRHLLDKYGDVETALAAYNGGQGNVERGVVYDETRAYVDDVMRAREVYSRVYPAELPPRPRRG